jgi:small GTP-binding protein
MSIPAYKVVLLGEAGVGKTAFVAQIMQEPLEDAYAPTVGAHFASRTVALPSGDCTLHLWDTAGQELYRSMVGFYAREARACVIVFDLTNQGSFEKVGGWVAFARENAPGAALFLFGNKTDIAGGRAVPMADAIEFADARACPYFEGSARTGDGVRQAVERIAGSVSASGDGGESRAGVAIADGALGRRRKCGCQ